jgi:hypothetical protein
MYPLKKFNSFTGDDGHSEVHIQLAFRDPSPDMFKPPLELAQDRPLPPVDGGIKAWSAIGGGFLALFVQFGLGRSEERLKNPISTSRGRPASMHT